jgi:hypothetical protein
MYEDQLTKQIWTFAFLFAGLQLTIVVLGGYLWLIVLFFRKRETAVGLLCTLLLPIIGGGWLLGTIIGLLFGWKWAKRWSIQGFMSFWSLAILLAIVNISPFAIMSSMSLDKWQHYFGWLYSF